MASKNGKMTKDAFIEWAKSQGWRLDRYGHLKKEMNGKTYRFKLSKIAVRYEVKVVYDSGSIKSSWMRLASGYYKNISISDAGKLSGMKR